MVGAPSLYSLSLCRLKDKRNDELEGMINKFQIASPIRKVLYFFNLFDDTYMDYLAAQTILEKRGQSRGLVKKVVD